VSASQLLLRGRLIDAAPVADLISAANRYRLASPLGWAPAPGGEGIVPTYPLGLPALMALFSIVGGPEAVYAVAPVMGLLTLWLVYRAAHRHLDEPTALLAVVTVAWNPVFIAYAKQPMSDVPATAWLLVSLVLAFSRSAGSAVWAGFAAGAAFLTRPALVLAGGLVPLLAMRGATPRRRALLSSMGVAAAVVTQMLLQSVLFGTAFTSGYGTADRLFSWRALSENLDIYARQAGVALGWLWLGGMLVGLGAVPRATAAAVVTLTAAVALPYLFYLRFDHWETLRFLLPALVPLSVVVAVGVARVARATRHPAAVAAVVLVFAGLTAVRGERLLRLSSAWDIQSLEARYPLAGQWLSVNTPPGSVALASQHSGSARWYGHRDTLRWDLMTPEDLGTTVRELHARRVSTYVVLEGAETAVFHARFRGVLDTLRVDPVGRVQNVDFLRLTPER
jgi:4-amino-4-deoxy-L-arabinose transferase-like glycosyltransferase